MTNPNNNPPANPPITVLPPGTNQFDEIQKLSRDAEKATSEMMVEQSRKL